MKTIFELIRIKTNCKQHYPLRKTEIDVLGLFSTLGKAEKWMHKDVKECQEYERKWLKENAEDEELRNDRKLVGHPIVLAYKISERELDTEYYDDIQSVRTYTADGQPNDECLLDYCCKRHFKGRTPDQIRFKPGDIVVVIDNWRAELCVIWHVQPTVQDYENNLPYWLENHKKRCQRWGFEYKEEEAFHWDYSDDSYLAYTLGEGNTHIHPVSTDVFFPTKPISKSLQTKYKAKYEEVLREEDEYKKQKELEKTMNDKGSDND